MEFFNQKEIPFQNCNFPDKLPLRMLLPDFTKIKIGDSLEKIIYS